MRKLNQANYSNVSSKTGVNANKVWIGIFAIWLVFLTGVLEPFFGSPGMLQAFELQRILSSKQQQIDLAENQLIALQDDSYRLERNPLTQEREIRKVLGYASPRDLIFDFSGDDPAHAPSAF